MPTIHARSLMLAVAADALIAGVEDSEVFDYSHLAPEDLTQLQVRTVGRVRRNGRRGDSLGSGGNTGLLVIHLNRYRREGRARLLAAIESGEVDRRAAARGIDPLVLLERLERRVEERAWSKAYKRLLALEQEEAEVPPRLPWWAREDQEWEPLRPVGDVIGFAGVA